jgi:UDP-N-acetylenolpyruvoylglucosamine reductase
MKNIFYILSASLILIITGCAELGIKRVDAQTFEYAFKKSQFQRRRQKVLNRAEFIGATSKNAYIEREIGGIFWDTEEVYWIPLSELPENLKNEMKKNLNKSSHLTGKPLR